MNGFFKKIREIFGLNSSLEVTEAPIEVLDDVIQEYNELNEEIKKSQDEFDEVSEELELKMSACDKLIEKGSKQGEFNKDFLQKKLDRVTDEYLLNLKDLNDKLSAVASRKIDLETDILTKSIEVVSMLSEIEQNDIKDSINTWKETGLVKGESIDYELKAIVKSIDLILNATDSEDELKKKVLTSPNPFLD